MQYPLFLHGACVVDDKIYVIGGVTTEKNNERSASRRVEVYKPATDSWSMKKSMPTARKSLTVSAVNGKIYAIGGHPRGRTEKALAVVEVYDPQTDTWDSTKAEIPTARASLTSCVVAGKIYAIGGWKLPERTSLADVEVYDPQTDTWTKKAPMKHARARLASCVVDGKIYVFGGTGPDGETVAVVEVYDPQTDTWTSRSEMPFKLAGAFAGRVDGMIYIFGGARRWYGPPMSYAWQYHPGTDTWRPVSRVPRGRFLGHAATVNGKIYLTGGSAKFRPYKPTPTVFEYDPDNDPYLSPDAASFSEQITKAGTPGRNFAFPAERDFRIKAEPLIPEKGPTPKAVNRMVQDKKGFLWFGTVYGLLKYDGYTITAYQHDPDNPNSLSDNEVKSILLDTNGHLWIGTRNGLNRLAPESDQITVYLSEPENPNTLTDNSITAIYQDRYGMLWIGTYNGLNRHDPGTDKIESIERYSVYGYGIWAIEEDSAGIMWLGSNWGLYQYVRESEEWTHYLPDLQHPDDPHSNFIRSLYLDSAGILWVGTSSGLLHFDPDDRGNIPFIRDTPKNTRRFNYSESVIWSIYEDRQGIMWFSSQSGLYRYDRKVDKNPQLVNCKVDRLPVNGGLSFQAVLEDNSGTFWVSTSRGICKTDNRRLKISSYEAFPDSANRLSSGWVTSLLEDDTGIVWVGTYNGLNRFDRKRNEWTRFFSEQGNPNTLSFNYVLGMAKDDSGYIWIGTKEGGLNRYDPEENRWQRYSEDVNPASLIYKWVQSVHVGKDNTVWAGTWFGILNRYDRQSDTFIQFKHQSGNPNTLSSSENILSILEDRSGMLWVGTEDGGLNRFDYSRNEFTRYQLEAGNPQSLNHNKVTVLYEDRNNILWIGTQEGLNRLDLNAEDDKNTAPGFTRYLSGKSISGILEDDGGNLWISAIGINKGLFLFNPESEEFTDFGYLLEDKELTLYAKSARSGEFFLGGDGLHIFHPAEISKNLNIPEVVLTDFQIFNQSVPVAADISAENNPGGNSAYLLEKSISATREIVLSYREATFAFEFAALHYVDPRKNQYAYQMEGFDNGWNEIGTRRYVSFSHLPAGEYNFRVKASNSDGVWNESGTSLKIIITPPWWETTWAYSLYLLIILAMVYGFWRFQTYRLKMAQQMEMEHFEAEKLREVDRLKSRFFANISHEFRTPITLILGPLQQLIEQSDNSRLRDTLLRMQRSGNRLLRLVNQLLDLSRLEAGKMTLHAARYDLDKTLRPLVMAFESLAGLREIELCYRSPKAPVTLYLDRDKFEKIIINLLSNAFKFTPEGGRVQVAVDIPLNPPSKGETATTPPFKGGPGGMLKITVSDTGMGIPAERLPFIFDRFYQADSSSTRVHGGSGIGLSLCKELVELHHGEITVESEEGIGTTFTISLPLGKTHLDPEQISDVDDAGVRAKHPLEDIEKHVEEFARDASPLPLLSTSPPIPEVADTQSPKGQAPIILLVEDNPDLRAYICEHLREEYQIIEAENGAVGFEKAAAEIPDLIVSDVMMPKMNGIALCGKIKSDQRTSHIPLILLTARADMTDKIGGLESGADDYLTKPFEARELRVRIHNLIEQRRRLRERFRREIILQPQDVTITSPEAAFLENAREIVEAHISEETFTVDIFCQEMGLSRMQLHRKLRALLNQSTRQFIRTLRLQRAANLLVQQTGNISEIAYACGFGSQAYFTTCFREQYGCSPSEYLTKMEK